MRVIAGRYGGRRLRAPAGAATRPTSERVREAVFSMLGPLDGAHVLDLFAGSGALGIEAISRGAVGVTFVERSPAARAVLAGNLEDLGIEKRVARIRGGDARPELRAAAARGETYDVVFLDPPYRQAESLGPELARPLAAVLAPGGRAVCETDRRSRIELALPLERERRYGDTLIRVHSRPEPPSS
ncbi:MAG: rRNA (guanine966-N2)-methyltransferase [Solirubrobacteraceae bacterium]|nr:rRNA (guanine966-N2)-methyltransferase [Solirubrobacteraceae bacterium]